MGYQNDKNIAIRWLCSTIKDVFLIQLCFDNKMLHFFCIILCFQVMRIKQKRKKKVRIILHFIAYNIPSYTNTSSCELKLLLLYHIIIILLSEWLRQQLLVQKPMLIVGMLIQQLTTLKNVAKITILQYFSSKSFRCNNPKHLPHNLSTLNCRHLRI